MKSGQRAKHAIHQRRIVPPAPSHPGIPHMTFVRAVPGHAPVPRLVSPPRLPRSPRKRAAMSGWAAFLRSFVYAWAGIVHAIRTQRNMRVHAALAVLAVVAGLVLGLSPVEFAIVFIAMTSVFVAEMMNTVIEATVDLAMPRYHPLARTAKDVAAGAVLVNAILSVVVALFIYLPHVVQFAQRLRRR